MIDNIKLIVSVLFAIVPLIHAYAETNDMSWDNAFDLIVENYNKNDLDAAIKVAMPFAQRGNSTAMNIIGCMYEYKKDFPNSRSWLLKAVEKGNVDAMFNLGLSYDGVNTYRMFEGSSVPTELQDLDKAKKYYLMAMNTSDDSQKSKFDAYVNYAVILFKKENEKTQAIDIITSCLRKTENGALRRLLGGFYEELNQPKDALRMYRLGAEYGDMQSMYTLGMAYMNPDNIKGLSISSDKKEAIKWFTKIAEIDNPDFNDTFGSQTQRAKRYLTCLYADLYYETYDELYLNQCLRWGCRADDIFADDVLLKIYQQGLSDSKQYKTYESWFDNVKKKYSVDSDIDINIPIAQNADRNKYVLIVANENYEYEAKVPYAQRDGDIFYKYMNQSLGIPKENIRLITDASLNKFLFEINWLKDVAKTHPSADIILYYAGHGLPSETFSTSYLLPVDGFAKNVNTGIDLNDLLTQLSFDNHTTVILDACFSGAKRDGKMMTAARGVAIKQAKPIVRNSTVVFSGCSDNETAYALENQQHGLFTYYFLKTIKDNKGHISFGELSDKLLIDVPRASMDINGKIQTPNIAVSGDLQNNWRSLKL